MLCRSPVELGPVIVGCGQCIPCRVKRRREWMFRMFLESLLHPVSSFVTLTYGDEYLPEGGCLVPRDLTLFLKRLRKALGPFRYFAVGEYGDKSWRPHYHLILFGVDPSVAEASIRSAWNLGYICAGPFSLEAAQYVSGYTVKKLTNAKDCRLGNRPPEFCRMSLRPGIGANAAVRIGEKLCGEQGCKALTETGDVPSMLQMGKKRFPVARYIRQRIRKEIGGDGSVPDKAKAVYQETLRALQGNLSVAAFRASRSYVDWRRSDRLVYLEGLKRSKTL